LLARRRIVGVSKQKFGQARAQTPPAPQAAYTGGLVAPGGDRNYSTDFEAVTDKARTLASATFSDIPHSAATRIASPRK
jgi:hypothetical protein